MERENFDEILLIETEGEIHRQALVKLVHSFGPRNITRVHLTQLGSSPVLTQAGFNAVVFDCAAVGRHELAALHRISILTNGLPILILANQISFEAYRRLDLFPNLVPLQKPFAPDAFSTLLGRLCTGRDYKPPVCPRFLTDEPAQVLVLRSGQLIHARVRNYSSGGLFIECRELGFQAGDQLKVLTVDSVAPSEDGEPVRLAMDAQVVWCREDESMRGAGLQFL